MRAAIVRAIVRWVMGVQAFTVPSPLSAGR
jgi:hypothetical protein